MPQRAAYVLALLLVGVLGFFVVTSLDETPEVAEAPAADPAENAITDPRQAGGEEMVAIVPSVRATELFDEVPAGAGFLAAPYSNPGGIQILYTISDGAEAGVYAVTGGDHRAVWTTTTDQMLEIAGFRGFEVFLVFTRDPFESPADAWSPDHSYLGLDLEAPGIGVYPSHLDAETIEAIRATIRQP